LFEGDGDVAWLAFQPETLKASSETVGELGEDFDVEFFAGDCGLLHFLAGDADQCGAAGELGLAGADMISASEAMSLKRSRKRREALERT
jgi:hypothetical protein